MKEQNTKNGLNSFTSFQVIPFLILILIPGYSFVSKIMSYLVSGYVKKYPQGIVKAEK